MKRKYTYTVRTRVPRELRVIMLDNLTGQTQLLGSGTTERTAWIAFLALDDDEAAEIAGRATGLQGALTVGVGAAEREVEL